MAETVLYEAGDGVATLTLNRPERLNAIGPELIDDLRAMLERAWTDAEVRAIRLRGAGRAFCAGYDIAWGAAVLEAEGDRPWDPIGDYQFMSRYVDTYMELWRSPKPVIAQVHGYCVGGGTDFALCSDLIVCSEDCRDMDVDLPAGARARQAGAADRRRGRRAARGRVGTGLRGGAVRAP